MKPIALIIRDGWGISPKGLAAARAEGNAPLLAKLPFHQHLYRTYPQSRLSASGEDVGLPAGQMGNSEVGHLNLGAGRVSGIDPDQSRDCGRVAGEESGAGEIFRRVESAGGRAPSLGAALRR